MDNLTIAVYAGKFLSQEDVEFVSALELQKFISEDSDNGGFYIELPKIRMVLDILSLAEFLDKVGECYTFRHKSITHTQVVKNIVPVAEREQGFLNLQLDQENDYEQ